MNELLAAAPGAEVVHGELACMLSLDDMADRPPRGVAEDEVLDLGSHRLRFLPTPHVPHNWESGLWFDETTATLFSGDLFTSTGAGPAITEDDLVGPALEAEAMFHATSLGPAVPATVRRLADARAVHAGGDARAVLSRRRRHPARGPGRGVRGGPRRRRLTSPPLVGWAVGAGPPRRRPLRWPLDRRVKRPRGRRRATNRPEGDTMGNEHAAGDGLDHHATARRLRDLVEPIAAAVYFAPEAQSRYGALGLNYFEGYFCSRSAGLGAAPWRVVSGSFAAFKPAIVERAVAGGWEKTTPDALLRARLDGAREQIERMAGEHAASFPAAADLLLELTDGLDLSGRMLFAGLAGLPIPGPDDPVGRLWRAADLVREHRGDGHIAAWIGDVDSTEITVLTELWWGIEPGSYVWTRGLGRRRRRRGPCPPQRPGAPRRRRRPHRRRPRPARGDRAPHRPRRARRRRPPRRPGRRAVRAAPADLAVPGGQGRLPQGPERDVRLTPTLTDPRTVLSDLSRHIARHV